MAIQGSALSAVVLEASARLAALPVQIAQCLAVASRYSDASVMAYPPEVRGLVKALWALWIVVSPLAMHLCKRYPLLAE